MVRLSNASMRFWSAIRVAFPALFHAKVTAAMPLSADAPHVSYQGSLLIAMPMLNDASFDHTVVYLCQHDDSHAMGLILNRPIDGLDFGRMLRELGIAPGLADGDHGLSAKTIFRGGPVQNDRGFVLHSPDYHIEDITLPLGPVPIPSTEAAAIAALSDGFALTATRDILVDLSKGTGPRQSLIALGYAGWGPGQLESELSHNAWLIAPATEDLIFGDPELLWSRALERLGVQPGHLSSAAGRA
jgi:putative transcriptional regulator